KRGRILADQLSHLHAVAAFLPAWQSTHDADCPICMSDVSSRGGIANVIPKVISDVSQALSASREEYKRNQSELKDLETQLQVLGLGTPSFDRAAVESVAQDVLELLGFDGTESSLLASNEFRSRIVAAILALKNPPMLPQALAAT